MGLTSYLYIFNVRNFSTTSAILNSILIEEFLMSATILSISLRASILDGFSLRFSLKSSISFLISYNSFSPILFKTLPCLSNQSLAYATNALITDVKSTLIKCATLSGGLSSNSIIIYL